MCKRFTLPSIVRHLHLGQPTLQLSPIELNAQFCPLLPSSPPMTPPSRSSQDAREDGSRKVLADVVPIRDRKSSHRTSSYPRLKPYARPNTHAACKAAAGHVQGSLSLSSLLGARLFALRPPQRQREWKQRSRGFRTAAVASLCEQSPLQRPRPVDRRVQQLYFFYFRRPPRLPVRGLCPTGGNPNL